MGAIDLGVLMALCLGAIFADPLRKVLSIELVSWSLRRQGIARDKIKELALDEAKKERANLVLQLVRLVFKK